jgi:hypothetical protein
MCVEKNSGVRVVKMGFNRIFRGLEGVVHDSIDWEIYI